MVLLASVDAASAVYKWRDKRGNFHASDDWRDVPAAVRVQILKQKPSAAPRVDMVRRAEIDSAFVTRMDDRVARTGRRGWRRAEVRRAIPGKRAVADSKSERGDGARRGENSAVTARPSARRGEEASDEALRVVVLSANGIRVPPEKRRDRDFWVDLVKTWRQQYEEARRARDAMRKEARLRAQIRQYIPLKIHTDAMLDAEAEAAKLEARMDAAKRVLDETIPALAREADADERWLR